MTTGPDGGVGLPVRYRSGWVPARYRSGSVRVRYRDGWVQVRYRDGRWSLGRTGGGYGHGTTPTRATRYRDGTDCIPVPGVHMQAPGTPGRAPGHGGDRAGTGHRGRHTQEAHAQSRRSSMAQFGRRVVLELGPCSPSSVACCGHRVIVVVVRWRSDVQGCIGVSVKGVASVGLQGDQDHAPPRRRQCSRRQGRRRHT